MNAGVTGKATYSQRGGASEVPGCRSLHNASGCTLRAGLRSIWLTYLGLLCFFKGPPSFLLKRLRVREGWLPVGLCPAPCDLWVHSAREGLWHAGKAGCPTGLESERRVRGTRLKAGGGAEGASRGGRGPVCLRQGEEQRSHEKSQGRVSLPEANEAIRHSWVQSAREIHCCVCNAGCGMCHFAVNA